MLSRGFHIPDHTDGVYPKADIRKSTQMQSFAAISREPESGQAAIASPAPKEDLLQTTPIRTFDQKNQFTLCR